MTICIANDKFFELKINRKQIKYAYIRVRPNKVLEVNAPVRMPYDLIADLIKQKSNWIISVSDTLEDNFYEKEINLMPVSKNEINDMKFEAEDAVYDSLERMYPLVKSYGVELPDLRVRYMTTRWGSCIVNKRRIWINVYLVKLPQGCMDYVVLHELVHLIHPNHGEKFYEMLNLLMPGWKEYKDILKRVKLPPKDAGKKAAYI